MAFQSVPDTAEAIVSYTLNGVTLSNSYYFGHPAGYDGNDLQNLADALDDWVVTEMLPLVLTSAVYNQVEVRGLENENDLVRIANAGAGAGSLNETPLPVNVAFCLKRLSGLTGRSARGRVYVGGIGAASLQSNENFISSTRADQFLDAHNAQFAYVTPYAWTAVVVSRYHNGAKRSVGEVETLLVWEYTDLRLDTRRDRLPGE